MQAITIPSYSPPSKYEQSTVPKPVISESADVIIEVHASSVNPIDVKKASGLMKPLLKEEFPYRIGYDCAGIVTAVGDGVSRLRVGDEVYSRFPEASRGTWAEYAKCAEQFVALKPKSLSFSDAASLPLAATTALQALEKYEGSLAGKTVFVPAGLSGTGAFACQLAKNVFGAGKVITTVSTAKIPRVPELLGEGVVDQIIDYTTSDPMKLIPPATVDFLLDTTGHAMSYLSLMVPSTSTIISISTTPSGTQMQASNFARTNQPSSSQPQQQQIPLAPYLYLNALDSIRKLRARRWGVRYAYMFVEPGVGDLERLSTWVEQGKVRAVVGARAEFGDIEAVRRVAGLVYEGRGGLGKGVISLKGD